MSSGGGKTGPPPKQGQGPFSGVAPSSQAILLDKLGRRSTPDSEALASSDDEPEAFRQDNIPPTVQPPKPMRRASWLNDTTQQQPLRQRKESFASSSMSPTTSHPSTPAADPGASVWGASAGVLGRNHSGSGTFTWGNTGIWNTDRKEPPSRLTEVLPSPTSAAPPGGTASSFFGNDFTQTSPGPRETPNSQLPFPIPLHPTPKTYRSQSYSVGQLEPSESAMTAGVPSTIGSRVRPMGHSGLQHRPSRPSMLSEMANDSSLGKVNEDDDDDSTGSLQGSQHQEQAKTIEMLTRENMMLRQQQQFQNQARLRPRASTSSWGLGNGYFTQEPVPEESDYAVDEHDEANDGSEMAARRSLARRMSEYGPGTLRTPYLIENRKLENVKKGIWQSSLGFGGLGEPPQSRRHSFADVPTRQASISSISEAALEQASQDLSHSQEFPSAYNDNANFNTGNQVPSYFLSGNVASPAQQGLGQVGPYHNQYASPYGGMPGAYANRPISPHRGMYGVTQPRHTQSLYIVLFKCSRADVFYIQEGTGLSVKPGDLVIVEADRGTDLGTVAKDNVDWQTAKEYKEHYAEEQYRWLMMYSQNATSQDGAGAGLMAASNGLQASAVGGMGPPSQNHMQEPNSGELKPKLIRRLAQPYEIQGLREKEGQEAKAKRVCQQKVKEHGLNMEILDAEFQVDWKKLTFYYFADSYINFNSLVTDLFKIYKTRIWMSAINPASFASPSLGLPAPSGIGPGAVVNRGLATAGRRQDNQQEGQNAFSAPGQADRAVRPAFTMPFAERAVAPNQNYPATNFPYNPYSAFANPAARAGAMPYAPGLVQGVDAYANAFPQGGDFAGRGRFPPPQSTTPAAQDQAVPALGPQADWVGSFQGLSLNSR